MPDQSHLDKQYFVDTHIYNCPFCNRRHVSYWVVARFFVDWTNDKTAYGFLVTCGSCKKQSMHLTHNDEIRTTYGKNIDMRNFSVPDGEDKGKYLDDNFFYSVPTSFLVLDARIPKVLRELLTEAEGCLKSNFLTGASACARKIIYELAVKEKTEGNNYDERIKGLKAKHPEIEPAYFDTLLMIQKLTSEKVHENSYDGWQTDHLRVILAALSEVLHELYVVPELRADKRKKIVALKEKIMGGKATMPHAKTPAQEKGEA